MAYESNSIFWIEVEKVVPNPFQPRREFDQGKLQELADSIRMYGILQPLVVTRREIIGENGSFTTEYELIAGERRLRASKLAGLSQVPVIIRSGEESQLMKLELAIIENLQREDLNAVDRALAFKQLAEQFGLSHSQVAQKVGRSREYVSNSIRLLGLPDTILDALRRNDISDGHARTLLMLNDRPQEQDVVFREILLKKLSVREVERISRKIASDKVRKKDWQNSDPELIEIEKQFTETFGTRVQILKTDYGGKLTIDYFAPEDLRKLLDMVHKGETVTFGTTDTKMLAHIEDATPLQAVPAQEVTPHVDTAPVSEAVSVPEGTPAFASEHVTSEVVEEEAVQPQYEDVFTRHDTLAVPETDFSATTDASYAETETEAEVLDKVADVQSYTHNAPEVASEPLHNQEEMTIRTPDAVAEVVSPATEVPYVPTPAPTEKKEDDTDLYSIRNFSL
jgi:ParB family chromosome partitioning protein